MKVKEESENVVLKLYTQKTNEGEKKKKTKIMAASPFIANR